MGLDSPGVWEAVLGLIGETALGWNIMNLVDDF